MKYRNIKTGIEFETSCIISGEDFEQIGKKEAPKAPRKATPKQLEILSQTYTGENLAKLLEKNGISQLGDISADKASELIEKIQKRAKNNG